MTDAKLDERTLEVLAVAYHLRDCIQEKRWPEALAAWEWLLNQYSPLATAQPLVRDVLRNECDLIAEAERQTSKIH